MFSSFCCLCFLLPSVWSPSLVSCFCHLTLSHLRLDVGPWRFLCLPVLPSSLDLLHPQQSGPWWMGWRLRGGGGGWFEAQARECPKAIHSFSPLVESWRGFRSKDGASLVWSVALCRFQPWTNQFSNCVRPPVVTSPGQQVHLAHLVVLPLSHCLLPIWPHFSTKYLSLKSCLALHPTVVWSFSISQWH